MGQKTTKRIRDWKNGAKRGNNYLCGQSEGYQAWEKPYISKKEQAHRNSISLHMRPHQTRWYKLGILEYEKDDSGWIDKTVGSNCI